jgi:hypothetical protein
VSSSRTNGDGRAGDAGRPPLPRARPQAFDGVPGYEFDVPRTVRDTGGFDAVRDTGGFDAVPRPDSFDAMPDGPPPPRNLRYTPTIAASGPVTPVPPPAEFTGPWYTARPSRRLDERSPTTARLDREPTRQDRNPIPVLRQSYPGNLDRGPYDRALASRAHAPESLPGQDTLRFRDEAAQDQAGERSLLRRLAAAILAAMRTRNVVTGLAIPIAAAISVGIVVVVIAGANSGIGGPAPSSLATGFPPATAAAADFTDTAALAGRGVSAPLGQAATFGSTIVAVGSQSGTRISRARFFVSSDAGRTWQLGAVQGNPPPGHAATLVAGGPHGWVAVGPDSVWTSPNGQSWLFRAALPQLAGDKITTLTSTSSGFLAAGENVPGGDAAKASPVVWLSANGVTWRRLGATQLNLAAGAGGVLGITHVAANGGAIVMSGTVAGAATSSGAWRSTDGGTSWTAVTIPAGGGASATIAGLAPLNKGFVAVRSAQVDGFTRADVYISPDGASWRSSAVLATADNSPLTVGQVSGGPGGAVVTGQAHGFVIAFLSANGVTWNGTDPITTSTAEQVSGAVLAPGGQAVIAGTSAGNPAQQQPLLTEIGANGGPSQVDMRAIPGAIIPEVAVNAVAASAATQVAAGSADGLPALWVSTDGGSTWARASGATPTVLTRPGKEQLTGVAHGAAGWLAVGGATATGQQPVVVGSADGRTWEAADTEAAFAGSGLVTSDAAAGPAGYVIVGRQSAGGHTIAAAWAAPGLTGWRRGTDAQAGALDGPGNRQMDAVAATVKGFVAVGSVGTRPAAWLSANGQAWSLVTLPLSASATRAELQYVAASGNIVAAAGTEVTAAGARIPFTAVSADGGATWTQTLLPVPDTSTAAAPTAAVTALAEAGGGFTATGTYGAGGNEDVVVWTLPRGAAPATTWTAEAPGGTGLAGPGIQAITALTAAGSTLTGVGFVATPESEEPTIWQSPVRS